MHLRFEWDPNKDRVNRRRHGISFEEAKTVFHDDNARIITDPEHSKWRGTVHSPGTEHQTPNPGGCPLLQKGGLGHPDHLGLEGDAQGTGAVRGVLAMRKSYDFSKSERNPYARALKRQITIRLDEPTIGYFRGLSGQLGVPYQSLINLYLRDCAVHHRKLHMNWGV